MFHDIRQLGTNNARDDYQFMKRHVTPRSINDLPTPITECDALSGIVKVPLDVVASELRAGRVAAACPLEPAVEQFVFGLIPADLVFVATGTGGASLPEHILVGLQRVTALFVSGHHAPGHGLSVPHQTLAVISALESERHCLFVASVPENRPWQLALTTCRVPTVPIRVVEIAAR